jgi:hypothetical protein
MRCAEIIDQGAHTRDATNIAEQASDFSHLFEQRSKHGGRLVEFQAPELGVQEFCLAEQA